jgi:hypothetical protein
VKQLVAWIAVLSAVACRDPVHDDAVDALGPETAGVEQGPLHRPGQPCTVCHGGQGPGDPTFDLAGTVYQLADSAAPAAGAIVHVVDAQGRKRSSGTNAVGTFFWEEGDLGLDFPLWTSIEWCGRIVEMKTPIFRERSCAACHSGPSASSVPQVFFAKTPEELCP